MNKEDFNVPFQVQNIIDSMNNKKENEHVRNNYRMRLDSIKKVIEKALADYDKDKWIETMRKTK